MSFLSLPITLLLVLSYAQECGPWSHQAKAGIPDHNTVSMEASVEKCKEECCKKSWCKSFDRSNWDGYCYLSDHSAIEAGGLKTWPKGRYDHYALAQAACGTWNPTPNAAIKGHNAEVLKDASVMDCMDACCQRPWCKSFDYVKGIYTCYLSKKNAKDKDVDLIRNIPHNPYDYWEIKRSEGVHVIGAWEVVGTYSRDPDSKVKKKVTKTFTSSTTEGSTESNYNAWSRDVTNAHRVSVSHTPSVGFGDMSISGPSAGYEYDHTEAERKEFAATLATSVHKTFTQQMKEETEKEIPKQVTGEPVYASVWAWKTKAIRKHGNAYEWSEHWLLANSIVTSGQGYDKPPNCLPNKCWGFDSHCWCCTDEKYKINPDWKPPVPCPEIDPNCINHQLDRQCVTWANKGHCTDPEYKSYMETNCCHTCRISEGQPPVMQEEKAIGSSTMSGPPPFSDSESATEEQSVEFALASRNEELKQKNKLLREELAQLTNN